MLPNPDQIRIAAAIDAKAQKLFGAGCDDVTIFTAMFDDMPRFKILLDTAAQDGGAVLNELCLQFPSFNRYARIIENIAEAIHDGAFDDVLGKTS